MAIDGSCDINFDHSSGGERWSMGGYQVEGGKEREELCGEQVRAHGWAWSIVKSCVSTLTVADASFFCSLSSYILAPQCHIKADLAP